MIDEMTKFKFPPHPSPLLRGEGGVRGKFQISLARLRHLFEIRSLTFDIFDNFIA